MRFTYNNKDYELTELFEPNKNETFDIIAIFEIQYCIWEGSNLIPTDKETFERTEDNFEKMLFVNYFYGADDEDENLIELAKEYIDRRDS